MNPETSIWWKLLEGSPREWAELLAGLAVVLLAIWAVNRMRTWFREDMGPTERNRELFLQMRELHRRGELTDDEFRSIRKRLLGTEGPQGEGVDSDQAAESPQREG